MKKGFGVLLFFAVLGAMAYWQQHAGEERLRPEEEPRLIALVQLTEVDSATVAGFKAGMEAAGFHEGQQVVYLSQGPAGSIDKLDGIITGHLARHPDLIMVSSTPATQAVKRLTEGTALPVVFAPVNDPLAAGIVSDLRHPGGHITGIRLPTGDDLRLEWLSRIAPRVKRIFVPYTPGDKSSETSREKIAEAAAHLGIEMVSREAVGKEGIEAVLASLPAAVDAIFLPRDSSVEAHIDLLVAYANSHRLPLCAPSYIQVERGALLSYGFVHDEIGRQAARLAVQIFKGNNTGDLPVEMAENILSLNTVAAARIGLTIPEDVLQQAEKIIRE